MHALYAPTEIDITDLTTHIACMILPIAAADHWLGRSLARTKIMQAFRTVLKIHKHLPPYESPA
jgi:hypothetical protein